MDNNGLENVIKEINELTSIMLDNIDNNDLVKFFTGKLSLLTQEAVTSCINSKN